MSDGLPDTFAARGGNFFKRYEMVMWRSPDDGEWRAETTVSIPVVGSVVKHAPRPVDEDHVRHVYENYEVVREGR